MISFRLKTILGIAAIETVLLLTLIWSSLSFIHDTNNHELQKRAVTTVQMFASAAKNAVLSTDIATLDTLAKDALSNPLQRSPNSLFSRLLRYPALLPLFPQHPSDLFPE